ncbi:MAG: hypothetical protein Q7T63_20715 [Burkholderiaceae bacterium]|nr:hypothetical protein [Burkholderiaceae bacterium]
MILPQAGTNVNGFEEKRSGMGHRRDGKRTVVKSVLKLEVVDASGLYYPAARPIAEAWYRCRLGR